MLIYETKGRWFESSRARSLSYCYYYSYTPSSLDFLPFQIARVGNRWAKSQNYPCQSFGRLLAKLKKSLQDGSPLAPKGARGWGYPGGTVSVMRGCKENCTCVTQGGVLRKVRVCNFTLKMARNDGQMETFWKHWARMGSSKKLAWTA